MDSLIIRETHGFCLKICGGGKDEVISSRLTSYLGFLGG